MTTEVNAPTLFDRAAKVFDGWTDPDTGMRVLRVKPVNMPFTPGMFSTFYHQYRCFLDGGRAVLLHGKKGIAPHIRRGTYKVDLTTGEAEEFSPGGYYVMEVFDETQMAVLRTLDDEEEKGVLWDLQADRELVTVTDPGWFLNSVNFLSDGKRALAFFHNNRKLYSERVDSRHYLLTPGEEPQLILDKEYYFCSHMVGHPLEANMYTYDCWPSPKRDIDQAISIRTLDGSIDEPVKLDANAPRPADMWGARDHYMWTPDGSRIVSYLSCHPIEFEFQPDFEFNHFEWQWWLSALDWRTGEDYAAPYPAGRWGGHMTISNDSKYIIAPGGPGFDKLFAVNIAELKHGWNEHIICSYPKTVSIGKNSDPFQMPWQLPDSSGVIFTAGWPGDEYGVYLVEWPKLLS